MALIKLANKEWDEKDGVVISNVEINTNVWGEAGICNVELKLDNALENLIKKEVKSPGDFSKVKPGVDFEVYLGYLKENDKKVKQKDLSLVFKGYVSKFEKIIKDGTGQQVL